MNLLSEERYNNIRDEHFEDINKIKEKKCTVAYDFDVSLKGRGLSEVIVRIFGIRKERDWRSIA
jgi:predicted CopG family antitoxin